MSYDIHVQPRRPGQSWEDVEEDEPEDGRPLGPADVARWERLSGELTELIGREQHDYRGDDSFELSDEETGLQVTLFAGSAAVTYPYWQHEDQAAFHRLVADVVAVVCRHTGWEAYDPQTGGTFGVPDDTIGLRATAWIERSAGGPAGPQDVYGALPSGPTVLPASHPAEAIRPAPSRARFHRYFWFGLIAVVAGIVLVSSGSGSSHPHGSAAPIGLGLLNLTVAARIYRRMRRDGTW